MRHTVKLAGVIVGHSDLENTDPGTQHAWGQFRPGLGYDLVQPIFRLYSEAVPRPGGPRDEALLERYHNARDKLQLELHTGDGRRIRVSTVHIADYTEESGAAAIELDVLIPDDAYWRRRMSEAVM